MPPAMRTLFSGIVLAVLVGACAHRPGPVEPAEAVIAPPVATEMETESKKPEEARWTDTDIAALLRAIDKLADHGLNPNDYHRAALASGTIAPASRDALADHAWRLAASHLRNGKVDPNTLRPDWSLLNDEPVIATALSTYLGDPALEYSLEPFAPRRKEYRALSAELGALRRRSSGQEDQIRKLRATLERWRWLPEDLGDRHLRVNIPDYTILAVRAEKGERIHSVIVGKTGSQTPEFDGAIEYVVFNPWWEVPTTLARTSQRTLFERDPGAVERLGFEVRTADGALVDPADIDWSQLSESEFAYRLRQAPGPRNAMGRVKLIFPNRHAVYLHDTPDKDLFENERRAFSSGCIRVQGLIDLAEWVLTETPDGTRDAINVALETGEETRIDLLVPVPVYILYLTAAADSAGSIRYFEDIYDRDQAVLAALDASR